MLAIPLVSALLACWLLLLAYAVRVPLEKLIAAILGALPIVGSAAARIVTYVFDAQYRTWMTEARWGTQAIADVINWPVNRVREALTWAATYAESVAIGLNWLHAHWASVNTAVNVLADRTTMQVAALSMQVLSLETKLSAGAYKEVGSLIDAALGPIRSTISWAVDHAAAQLKLAEDAWGQAIDGVNSAIDDAKHALRTAIDHAVNGVLDTLNQRVGPIETALLHINPVIASITGLGIIGLVQTTAAELDRLKNDCIEPGCEALGPSIDWLNLLNGGVTLAAMVALVEAAQSDPEGTASEVVGATDALAGTVGSVLGIRLGA